MADDKSGEKTEKPTPKKRKESRKEGQVPRTPELGGWGTLLAIGVAMPLLASHEIGRIREFLTRALLLIEEPSTAKGMQLFGEATTHAFVALVVLGAMVMVLGVSAALSQGGFYLATKMMKPKLSKLDPIKGAKRIFGPQALWEGAKTLIKTSIVAVFAYGAVRSIMPLIGGLMPIEVVLQAAGDNAVSTLRNIGMVGVVMAGADYAMQRRRIGKQTRMTKDEVKRESKQTEGDPLVKSAIRARQLATSRNRMIADVPTADVVLVNPTHVAVALRYDPARGAPTVVARGAGLVAARIREEAAEHGVPLVRDVPLARAVYGATTVGQEIPAELFAAVAQVLAFVISRRNQGHRGGEHPTPRAGRELPPVGPGRRRIPSGPRAPGR
ncbi:flagellar biosynthesis protein FlhB [Nocardioides sp.]|uniref:EscU/YscU/HrcU family type III secretion system export apparatus switch protein n=1 Tax=Nocardioides sp. TaxID=35761 RepID=UPI002736FF23|nr:EscU/YscU/HrcU family type III secretion system export apparatus switch protein [Nocardioides sp.]MDP3890259.1 EscU/YscU/HrcU family type III secretion system export apparatus switch protein [Nocardioides sp.]